MTMGNASASSRHIEFIIKGFDFDSSEGFLQQFKFPSVKLIEAGDKLGRGKTVAKKNTLTARMPFTGDESWDSAIERFFGVFGGTKKFRNLMIRINAEDRTLGIIVPVRGSPYQENNFLSRENIKKLANVEVDLAFDFPDFDYSDKTHLCDSED